MGHAHSIRENPGQLAGIAALSAAIGAITALLVTPRTGQQMRGGIKRRAMSSKDTVMDKMHGAKDQVADTIETANDEVSSVKQDAADKTQDITRETKNVASQTRRNSRT